MDDKMNCGCSPMCENCAKGDHANCTSGTCTWKDKTTTNDMDDAGDGSDSNEE